MHLGYTRFKVDTQTHDVTFLGGKLIPVDATNLSADKQTTSLIEQQRQLHPAVNEKVAVLTSAAVRKYNKESNIGNLLTDYMRQGSNSDIAFLNSGAIRADLNTGPVTIEHLINTYPFVDHLTVVELTGKQVRQLIEYSLTLPYGIGQVSGLEIEYDSLQPAMQRLRSIKHQGEELNDTQKYTVSTTAFVANGGDGYQVFTEGKVVDNKQLVADILYSEFKKAGRIVPPGLGRLVDVNILD
jgi:2',3'-cyclic-nucleotide 2'-phosphodiesterase (5'-nucleotidase family)